MSVVTYAELRAGPEMQVASRARNEAVLGLLIARIPVLSFDTAAAEHYGELWAAVRECSRDALDRMIAAYAVSSGATLVTNNEADFADYPGIILENWAR